MTDVKTAATQPAAKKAAPKAAKKPKLDALRIRDLADQISGYPHGAYLENLIARLSNEQGLKITEKPKGSGRFVAAMGGIVTKPAPSEVAALTLWANKARREAGKVV